MLGQAGVGPSGKADPVSGKTKAPAADDLEAAPFPQHDPNKKAVWGQSHQFSLPVQGTPDPDRRAAPLKVVNATGSPVNPIVIK